MMSTEMERCLHQAFVDARAARHEFMTVEHLLLALLNEADVIAALRSRSVNIDALRDQLVSFIAHNTPVVPGPDEVDTQPTLGFQRVVERGIMHMQSTGTGKTPINGLRMLLAVFGEKDSHAVYYLREQGFTREELIAYLKAGDPPGEAPAPALDDAEQRARDLGLDLTLHSMLGSLDRVSRIVELHGALNTTEDFEDHAKVLDGASDLLVEVFGPAVGVHARSVIGAVSLRNGVPLTLKLTVEVL